MDHEFYMSLAYKEALKALKSREIPVGAVIVQDQQIISQAHNKKEKIQSVLAHAEILALEKACRKLKSWRLKDCRLYVTLEPCLMCAGAIGSARIHQLIYACQDPKIGAVHSSLKVLDHPQWNHKVDVVSGVMAEPCSNLLKDFFQNRRKH